MGSPAYEVVETEFGNSCYLSAFATFLRVGLYEAHAILMGGPIPSYYGRLRPVRLPEFRTRLKRLGFGAREKPAHYVRSKQDALLVVAWDRGQCHTLHCVVWDGARKVRVDCSNSDTTARYKGLILEAFTLTPEARARIVSGVTKGLAKVPDPKPDYAEAMRRGVEAHRQAQARVREAFPGALLDAAIQLGA